MEHLVTVGTDRKHIPDWIDSLGLAFEGREFRKVMDMDVSLPNFTINFCEIERADPANSSECANACFAIPSAALIFIDEDGYFVSLFRS